MGRVSFTVQFGLRHHVWAVYVFAIALAVTVMWSLLMSETATPEFAAVLTIPTSLVTAVVVVRDAPLTARFLDAPRYALIAITLLLWSGALWRLLEYPWWKGS